MIDLVLKSYCQHCNQFRSCTHESITSTGVTDYVLTCANIMICENIELTLRKEMDGPKLSGPFDI